MAPTRAFDNALALRLAAEAADRCGDAAFELASRDQASPEAVERVRSLARLTLDLLPAS
jgi:hypothetical protein